MKKRVHWSTVFIFVAIFAMFVAVVAHGVYTSSVYTKQVQAEVSDAVTEEKIVKNGRHGRLKIISTLNVNYTVNDKEYSVNDRHEGRFSNGEVITIHVNKDNAEDFIYSDETFRHGLLEFVGYFGLVLLFIIITEVLKRSDR